MTSPNCKTSLAGLALLLAATAANAQERDEDVLMAPFARCGALAEDAERLACFDAALAGLPQAQEAAAERSEAEIAAGFGLSSDQLPTTGPAASVDPATTIVRDEDGTLGLSAKVADVSVLPGRPMLILLENGQLWRRAGNSSSGLAPRAGLTATITPSRFGGHRMRLEGLTGFISVIRVR